MFKMDVAYDAKEMLKMRDELKEAQNNIIWDIADQIFAESQVLVPVDKATLKKSGNIIFGSNYAFIGYNTPYAKPIHDGYSEHVQNVQPHLRNMNGVMVRVREHDRLMPARTGRPYLDDAIEKVLKGFDPSIRDLISVTRIERLEG